MDRMWLCAGVLVACVFLLTGCDPEEMVKRKTPGPIKSVLQFTEDSKKKPQVEAPKPTPVIEIVKPRDNGFADAGLPVTFEGQVDGKGLTIQDNQLSWKVMPLIPAKEKGKPRTAGPPKPIGNGKSARTNLAPGAYQVELTLNHPEAKVPPKRVTFKVGTAISGVVKHNGKPLPETRLSLVDLSSRQEVAYGVSGKDGAFSVELPFAANFRLSPQRRGFAFEPAELYLKKGEKSVAPEFSATKAWAEGMKLTETGETDEPLATVCPLENAVFRAHITAEKPLKSMTVTLIEDQPGARPIPIGEWAREKAASGQAASGEGGANIAIPVQVPVKALQGAKSADYRLRLVFAMEESGGRFSIDAPNPVRLDSQACAVKMLAEAVELHVRGEIDKALEIYDVVEDMTREQIADASLLTLRADKILFNEGLAFLTLAVNPDLEESKRAAYAARALTDFKELTRTRMNDVEAFTLMGLAFNIRKDYESALDALRTATRLNPKYAEAYELSGLARLGSRKVGDLNRAIDDFTAALTLKPDNQALRKLRAACLVMDLNQEGQSEGTANYDSLPMRKPETVLKLDGFIRAHTR
jgi:tetratricopeptide (TPR) repeat protein